MKYDPQKHHRRSIRLKGYDYSRGGAYYVTIVTQGRQLFLGEIARDEMIFNDAGEMIKTVWESMPGRFPNIELGAYVVMPNHFHAIVLIRENVGATLVVARDKAGMLRDPAPTKPTLGMIIGAFKSISTHQYIKGIIDFGWPLFERRLWQRNYYEHIIRNTEDLNRIHSYIESNPSLWSADEENPLRAK